MEFIHKYLSEPGFLVQHHIDSYHHFLDKIPVILQKKNPLTILKKKVNDNFDHECNMYVGGRDGSDIVFGNPLFHENGNQKMLFPNDARLRNMTYSFSLHAKLTFVITILGKDVEEFTTPLVLIGYFPIMVQSKQCVLHRLPDAARFEMGECTSDPGGYFIIDGSEKVIISQEGTANNTICVVKKHSDKAYYAATIRSESEDEDKLARRTTVSIITREDPNQLNKDGVSLHQIVVEIPDVHTPIPLFIVMRALGIVSDKQIIDTCLQGDSHLMDYFHDSICDAGSVFTQSMAVQFIGTFTKYHSIHYSLRILSELFLPHIGELNFIDKAYFLGHMVKKVLRVAVGLDPATERDSFRYKRIDTSGILLTHLFTDFYSKQLKEVNRSIDRTYNKNEKLYDDPEVFATLFKNNYHEFFEERITEKGILAGFKGRWGATAYSQRVGVAQSLNRLSYNSSVSLLRKCVLQLDASAKVTAPRLLHGSQWGVFDPVDTPDGHDVGAHKHLAITTRITEGFPKQVIVEEMARLRIDIIPLESFDTLHTRFFLNGEWHGCLRNPEEIVPMLKMSRRYGRLPVSTSISWNIGENTLYVSTDAGRLQRPLFYVEEGRMVQPDSKLSWRELTEGTAKRPCSIEYIDAEEANSCLIAFNEAEITIHTHVEIHASSLLGFMGNQIIFPDHSPLPRNSFSCGQSKQAVSMYHTNHQNRMDTMGVVLNYGQMPLIQSSFLPKFKSLPYGVNAIVAIMCYTGYNTEDAILFNRGSLERGLFNTSYFKTYEMNETEGMHFEGGSNTDQYGLVPIHTEVQPETVLMRMVGDGHVKNINPKRDQKGRVDRTFITDHQPGHRIAKVRICHERSPSIGDKFASRAGQKGTCGLIINEDDMPFTSYGVRPDLIINPHAMPSRMTLGQLMESVLGKANVHKGYFGDCTAFNTELNYKEDLNRMGFHSSGTEVLTNGMSGEMLESDIFIGPTYYLRLKHMVEDKINYRPRGPMTTLTRQPVQGRSNEGGLRIGEMERDGVIANGMAAFVRESMMTRGDGTVLTEGTRKPYHIYVDNTTGLLAVFNDKVKRSLLLDGTAPQYERSFSVLNVPYSFKLLLQELATMNVQMRLITSDNMDQLESMKGKEVIKMESFSIVIEPYSVKENRLFVSSEAFVTQEGQNIPNCFNENMLFYHKILKPTMFPCVESKLEWDMLNVSVRDINPQPYTSLYHRERCALDIYRTDKDSFERTLNYYWNHMKTGIVIRIKNNKVFNFIWMYNTDYTNNFDIKNLEEFLDSLPEKKRSQTSNDPTTWHATNCLLRTEKKKQDTFPTDAYLSQIYDMLMNTCSHRKVNDCLFFMTRKDFPHLRKDWKESFDAIYGDADMAERGTFMPVVAQSTTVNHADFPFPTGDDWEDICKEKWFATYSKGLKCKNDSTKLATLPPWRERKDEVVWRGQGTGCGNRPDNNPRIKLDQLTIGKSIPGLDARIVRFTDRIKAFRKDDGMYVEYVGASDGAPRMDMKEQVHYKFAINVEGNSAAYRFGPLLGLGFCILNIESKYTLWFEPMIRKGLITDKDISQAHCISVKHDLSNLGEVIQWCKEHDTVCEQISQNAMSFYRKHFTKDFIYDYVADLCNSMSSLIVPQTNIFEIDRERVLFLKPSKAKLNVLTCKEAPGQSGKTIILVPFRDDGNQNRTEQLQKFLEHYRMPILVIEQSSEYKFNRGALLNIGYDFCCEKLPHFTTFVLHDVDILMSEDVIRKYYTDDGKDLMHLGNLIKDSKYSDTAGFLGRVLRVSKDAFKSMNGFPNTFYGWGGEDDALVHRIGSIPLYRPKEPKEGIEMATTNDIIVTKDKAYTEEFKTEGLIADQLQWHMDGLVSLQYSVVENKQLNEWAHKITIQLSPTTEITKEKEHTVVEEKEEEQLNESIEKDDSVKKVRFED